jgi:hypothetical protein
MFFSIQEDAIVVGSFEGESGDLEGAADVVGSEAYETKTSSIMLDLGSHF